MHLNALLDIDLVAVEAEDQVCVLLELEAPGRDGRERRAPSTLEVVLDRSGSMADGRLEAAKDALEALVARLDPADNFGLVAFDDTVEVAIPAGPLADKDHVRHLIRGLYSGATTNLSGGLLRGAQEARRAKGDRGATLLLLSDGHANVGITDHAQLERAATAAHGHGVTSSTIGLDLGYDEALLAAIARVGQGNTHFAEEADTAGAAVASEVEYLLEQVVQAPSLTVRPTRAVEAVHLFNDLPAAAIEGGFAVELGDFYAGERRKLLLTIDVPAMTALGLAQVCQLELRWIDVSTLDTHTATIPVHVNVVPGDAAAGRVPDATVRSELAFHRAQRAKKEAADAMRTGDVRLASALYDEAGEALDAFKPMAAPAMEAEIGSEAELLRDLSPRALHDDASRMAKFTEMDRHYKERRRRRRRPGDAREDDAA